MSEDKGKLVTVVGSIVKEDPTLVFSPQGHAICKFSIRVPGEKQEDGTRSKPAFYDIVAWRELAENAAESLLNGARVIVRGLLKTRSWEYEGKPYTATEINAWNVGPDLSYCTATVAQVERTGPAEAPAEPVAAAAGYGDF